MDRGGWVRAAFVAASTALVVMLLGVSDSRAAVVKTRKGVSIALTAVRGSTEGDEYVDEKLGEIGKQLLKKFKLKRVELIDQMQESLSSHWEIKTTLGDNLKMTLLWRTVQGDVFSFHVAVSRGADKIIDADQQVKLGATVAVTGKLGPKECLILLIVPNLDPSADD